MPPRHNPESLKQVVATIRMFLRWEFARGALSCPLHLQLDTIRVYRDQRTPSLIPWPELQRLLRKLDRTTPQGLRDFTILLLATTYGLRRSEVAGLTLDDIDWRQRQLRIAQPKSRLTLRLPLTNEVERALIRYLKRGRPATSLRHVFICQSAPARPLSPHGVYGILDERVRPQGFLPHATLPQSPICPRSAFAARRRISQSHQRCSWTSGFEHHRALPAPGRG